MCVLKKEEHSFKDFFNLSISLAKAEFKLRNEGSYLGILWYLLNTLNIFNILISRLRSQIK